MISRSAAAIPGVVSSSALTNIISSMRSKFCHGLPPTVTCDRLWPPGQRSLRRIPPCGTLPRFGRTQVDGSVRLARIDAFLSRFELSSIETRPYLALKINGLFQYKIIIFQGQFSTLSAFSTEKSNKSRHLYCNSQYPVVVLIIRTCSPSESHTRGIARPNHKTCVCGCSQTRAHLRRSGTVSSAGVQKGVANLVLSIGDDSDAIHVPRVYAWALSA